MFFVCSFSKIGFDGVVINVVVDIVDIVVFCLKIALKC